MNRACLRHPQAWATRRMGSTPTRFQPRHVLQRPLQPPWRRGDWKLRLAIKALNPRAHDHMTITIARSLAYALTVAIAVAVVRCDQFEALVCSAQTAPQIETAPRLGIWQRGRGCEWRACSAARSATVLPASHRPGERSYRVQPCNFKSPLSRVRFSLFLLRSRARWQVRIRTLLHPPSCAYSTSMRSA